MKDFKELLRLLHRLCNEGFTGQIRINFHAGKASKKVEKKEAILIT